MRERERERERRRGKERFVSAPECKRAERTGERSGSDGKKGK